MTSSLTRTLLFASLLLLGGCVPDFLVSNPEWVVIDKDEHEPLPKRNAGIVIGPDEVSATVTFDSTCIYDIGTADQDDWNKVIGIGFVGSKNQDITTGVPPHQVDGVRVGWRWSAKRGRIELGAYAYVDAKRIDFKVAETGINVPTRLVIKIDYDRKLYQVLGGQPIPFTHNKTFAYKTGLYFGGSYPAPHQIRVKIVE